MIQRLFLAQVCMGLLEHLVSWQDGLTKAASALVLGRGETKEKRENDGINCWLYGTGTGTGERQRRKADVHADPDRAHGFTFRDGCAEVQGCNFDRERSS